MHWIKSKWVLSLKKIPHLSIEGNSKYAFGKINNEKKPSQYSWYDQYLDLSRDSRWVILVFDNWSADRFETIKPAYLNTTEKIWVNWWIYVDWIIIINEVHLCPFIINRNSLKRFSYFSIQRNGIDI